MSEVRATLEGMELCRDISVPIYSFINALRLELIPKSYALASGLSHVRMPAITTFKELESAAVE